MAYRTAGLQTYTLQSSISSTQTTINLSSFTVPVTDDPVTMSLLGTTIVYATIDPKTNNSEFISFTGITQNLDGTATLTGVTRGLNKTYPFTEDTDFKLPHSGAAQFIISNPPQLYNKLAVLENDNTFTATNNFTGVIKVPTGTSGDTDHAASIQYVNDIAISGGADASSTVKGISKLSVNPVSPTNPIAVGDNDTRMPTQGENDALAGTSGTPSSSNKYVTNDDTTGTGSVIRSSVLFNLLSFGDGSDGALSVSSGTTNIDLGGAKTFLKQYTSISITGTGQITFSNPHSGGTLVVFRSQGNVTITSSATPAIELTGIGAASDTNANGILDNLTTHKGTTGISLGVAAGGTRLTNSNLYITSDFVNYNNSLNIVPGSGGGTGGPDNAANSAGGGAGAGSVVGDGANGVASSSNGTNATNASSGGGGAGSSSFNQGGTPGAGGRGGGAMLISCGGALNFTGTIYAKGTAGGNATSTSTGGGGGGAGGMVAITYVTLTAGSGTIDTSGGAGGTSSGHTGGTGGASNPDSGKLIPIK